MEYILNKKKMTKINDNVIFNDNKLTKILTTNDALYLTPMLREVERSKKEHTRQFLDIEMAVGKASTNLIESFVLQFPLKTYYVSVSIGENQGQPIGYANYLPLPNGDNATKEEAIKYFLKQSDPINKFLVEVTIATAFPGEGIRGKYFYADILIHP